MLFIRLLSRIFVALAAGITLWDTIYSVFIKNKFKLRSFKELWMDIDKPSYADFASIMKSFISNWDKVADWAAPLVLLIPAVIFYVIFKLVFILRGGRGGDGFNYKSAD